MSHDRGCPCGRERWEFLSCYAVNGSRCSRASVVERWMSSVVAGMNVESVPREQGKSLRVQMWRSFYGV